QPRSHPDPVVERHRSYWAKSAKGPGYRPLAEDASCDVAVVGAGIVGVTTALDLARAGFAVALLEARRVGSGATGYTTAKLSSLHGLTYRSLESSLGADTARIYATANEAGLARVASTVAELGIDCDFRRKPNFTYSETDSGRRSIAEEADAARRAGLAATMVDRVPELPYPVSGAVRVGDQAEFHPLSYLHGLAAAAADAGARIHEGTRVVSVDQDDPCRVITEGGATIRARHAILATHMPILDRGLFFARTHPERSYVLLARLRSPVPEGMYLSDERPAHSLRAVPTPGGERLMVGGESHKAGQGDQAERYRALEAWARDRFEVEAIEHRWATQDNMPADGLPFVGRLWPFSERLLTATGMRKWGLAMGTSAATILADAVRGTENPWAGTFSPIRLHPLAGGPDFVKENVNAGLRFLADRVTRRSSRELSPDEGAVVGSGLAQRAVYRDEAGELHSLSARCTHLGCIVAFNAAERTWDCPCHGSRFDLDGSVIEGPAVRGLRRDI
ncbi:MAG TPA: FAD-dependent oxidoreductase, partial [Solirubrobacterales bacterium]|nr:FAD-dependent oxidoreductase [Solirubrobacterales bacterium]